MTTLVSELATLVWQRAHNDRGIVTAPSRDFCMTCRGKVLDADDDTATLADVVMGRGIAGYRSNNTPIHLHVWPRQRGGCFMVSLSILGVIMTALVGSTCTCGLSLFIIPVLLPLLFILPLCCL